jgi:hypothetical protein
MTVKGQRLQLLKNYRYRPVGKNKHDKRFQVIYPKYHRTAQFVICLCCQSVVPPTLESFPSQTYRLAAVEVKDRLCVSGMMILISKRTTKNPERRDHLLHHAHRHPHPDRRQPQLSEAGVLSVDARMGRQAIRKPRLHRGRRPHDHLPRHRHLPNDVVFFNFFGDLLRAALDPKLK